MSNGFVLYPDAWTNAAVRSEVCTFGTNVAFAADIGYRTSIAVGISEPPPIVCLHCLIIKVCFCLANAQEEYVVGFGRLVRTV